MKKETIKVEFTEKELRMLMRGFARGTKDMESESAKKADELYERLYDAQMELSAIFINNHFPSK